VDAHVDGLSLFVQPQAFRRAMIALQLWRAISALAATQILGWGSTYFLPAMLGAQMARDLDFSVSFAFAGVTIMLVVSAFVGPAYGRWADRRGPRALLMAGSTLMAIALFGLGISTGPIGYAICWIFLGFAMPMALTPIPFVAAAWLLPGSARRAVGAMTLLGGATTVVFLPLMAWLEPAIGWRAICFLFAAGQILLCLPLHAMIAPQPTPAVGVPDAPVARAGIRAPAARRAAFWAMALSFSCIGFVTWGLPLQLVAIGGAYGLPLSLAVAVGALLGPSQMASRLLDILFGLHFPILKIGLLSQVLIAASCALPWLLGGSFAILAATVVGFGLGAGANTVVRIIAPLAVFGREGYASLMGRMNLPLNLVFATAPFLLAAILEAGGPAAPLLLCAVLSLLSFVGLSVVKRIADGQAVQ
jgi:MFS family permease